MDNNEMIKIINMVRLAYEIAESRGHGITKARKNVTEFMAIPEYQDYFDAAEIDKKNITWEEKIAMARNLNGTENVK